MISKPTQWDSIPERGVEKLPMGEYVSIIRNVTDNTTDQFLEIEYDIVEPAEFKGIAAEAAQAFGKWTYSFRVYYTEKAMWKLKKFISRVEKTNQGFSFDWGNPQCLINRGVGLIIGYRQYYSNKDGSLREALDVQDFCTAKEARTGVIVDDNGNERPLPEPKIKEPRTAIPVAKIEEVQASDEEEGELPF